MPTLAQLAQGPAFGDVWNYLPNLQGYNPLYADQTQKATDPYTFSGGQQAQQASGENGIINADATPVQMQVNDQNIPDQYKGLVGDYGRWGQDGSWISNKDHPEVNGQNQFRYDLSGLPDGGMTKFGVDVVGTTSLGSGKEPDWGRLGAMKPADKSAVYFDPNYGWITPNKNLVDKAQQGDWLAPAIVGGITMGAGALGLPAMASGLVGAARTFGDSGNWQSALTNILPGLIGAGLGGQNLLPPELMQALQAAKGGYGVYNGLRRGNYAGAAGSGALPGSDGRGRAMSDWSDGFDWSNWSDGSGGDWQGGFDLPGGGDTGYPLQDPTSFNVGPGQIPSDVYQQLLQFGGLQPGMSTSIPGGGGGGGGGGGALSGLAKLFGGNLSSILPLLGIGAGAWNQYNATNKASDQLQKGIENSNKVITDTLSGNKELYEPWRQAGLAALAKVQAQAPSNLAGQFGGGIAGQFGGLAGNYNSLGSGKGIKLSQMAKGG